MGLPDCPLYHGTWICAVCVRSGRDFKYTFCRLFTVKNKRAVTLALHSDKRLPPL